MAGKDIIMATQEELKKLHVVRKAMESSITQSEAAEILDLSDRQVRRIASKIRLEGDAGVIHHLRGKPSNRALPNKQRVLKIFKAKYPDFGPTLASEKLFERDKLKINDVSSQS
ncbi:MAG: helix-turn-helix domain-containing protein [Candidatus Omnitrophica bacterium]|nr:helix-turn-helix domain-containing protein [Candidatus Omnitrophota bacterium]